MANSYVGKLIKQVRRQTENEDVAELKGITDEEILYYLNDAEHRLQSKIVAKHPKVFTTEATGNTQVNQRRYELPRDMYLQNKIVTVELRSFGTGFYDVLDPLTIRERNDTYTGIPNSYIRHGGEIEFEPSADSSYPFRITYVREINEIDLRRGKIEFVNLDTSNRSITQLRLETSGLNKPSKLLEEEEYICVVDRKGNIKMKGICISDIDFTTGIITIEDGFQYCEGETISSGDYIVRGEFTSTHSDSKFAKTCERYFVAYVAKKLLHRDSAAEDLMAQNAELRDIENDIVEIYSDISEDITNIPEEGDFGDWI